MIGRVSFREWNPYKDRIPRTSGILESAAASSISITEE